MEWERNWCGVIAARRAELRRADCIFHTAPALRGQLSMRLRAGGWWRRERGRGKHLWFRFSDLLKYDLIHGTSNCTTLCNSTLSLSLQNKTRPQNAQAQIHRFYTRSSEPAFTETILKAPSCVRRYAAIGLRRRQGAPSTQRSQ